MPHLRDGCERKRLERGSGLSGKGVHADFTSRFPAFKLYDTCDQREQGMVSAQVDIKAREKLGASLSDDDATCLHGLSAVGLHAEILRVAVPAVA